MIMNQELSRNDEFDSVSDEELQSKLKSKEEFYEKPVTVSNLDVLCGRSAETIHHGEWQELFQTLTRIITK